MKLFKFQKNTATLISTYIKRKKSFVYHIPDGCGRMIILWHLFTRYYRQNFCVNVGRCLVDQWTNWSIIHPLKNVKINSLRDATWLVQVDSPIVRFIKL